MTHAPSPHACARLGRAPQHRRCVRARAPSPRAAAVDGARSCASPVSPCKCEPNVRPLARAAAAVGTSQHVCARARRQRAPQQSAARAAVQVWAVSCARVVPGARPLARARVPLARAAAAIGPTRQVCVRVCCGRVPLRPVARVAAPARHPERVPRPNAWLSVRRCGHLASVATLPAPVRALIVANAAADARPRPAVASGPSVRRALDADMASAARLSASRLPAPTSPQLGPDTPHTEGAGTVAAAQPLDRLATPILLYA
eukprot:4590309-Pleurochrysis_carterae.AAC.2